LHFTGSSATALPGLIILKIYPDFLKDTIGKYPEKVILITGTNGKTTTSHLLTHLLKKSNFKVFHNHEGSNMERGIASEILKSMNWYGQTWKSVPTQKNTVFDWYIIESDEGSFPRLLQELLPQTVVLLNIFRDQLDRYGEINGLMTKWEASLNKFLPKNIIFNADDPNVTFVIDQLKRGLNIDDLDHRYRGYSVISDNEKNFKVSADRVFCPKCNAILLHSASGMVKDFKCEKCGFKKMKVEYVIQEISLGNGLDRSLQLKFNNELIGMPLVGKYNYYNLAGACSVFYIVGGDLLVAPHADRRGGLSLRELLQGFRSAFGRFEKINYKNKFFHVILAKNPAGMDSVLKSIKPDNLMMGLNDKIADGEDVSWIYDVDFETHQMVHLDGKLILSGTRAYDLALRIKIAGKLSVEFNVEPDMKKAFEEFLFRVENAEESAVIVTYTCLMELEKIMYSKKLISKLM
jgi:lipid II isoglutaminyl synthase (glutamine-hydrolysing)